MQAWDLAADALRQRPRVERKVKVKAPKPAVVRTLEPVDEVFLRLQSMRSRAAVRKVPFDLDREWLVTKLALTHCEVTRLPFSDGPWKMTIDRRVPADGYTKANCDAVVWMYNAAKNKHTHEDVMRLVAALGGEA